MEALQRRQRIRARSLRPDVGLELALAHDVASTAVSTCLTFTLMPTLASIGIDGLDDRQAPAFVLAGGPFELEAVRIAGLGQQLLRLLRIEGIGLAVLVVGGEVSGSQLAAR